MIHTIGFAISAYNRRMGFTNKKNSVCKWLQNKALRLVSLIHCLNREMTYFIAIQSLTMKL